MATIEKLPSGSYRARVHIGGGKYKSITRQTKKEVQLEAAKLEAEREEKSPLYDMTVREAMEKYIEIKSNVLSPRTVKEYNNLLKVAFLELQPIKLYELTQDRVQIAVNELAAQSSPKTVRNKYAFLSSVIKMYRPNTIFNINLPQRIKHEAVIPTEEDIIALIRQVRGTDIEIPVLLAALCGLRASEIAGLKWSCVNFEKGTITIEAAKVYGTDSKLVLKGTKSVAGQRKIKILPEVYNALKRNYKPENEFVSNMLPNTIYSRYTKALKECCPDKHYTFHELRHYACSVMIMLGIPNKYIADYLGHETEDMVNRVYGHIMRDKKDEMFDRVVSYYDNVFEKVNKNEA